MTGIMSNFKKVEVLKVDYKYSFGNQAHKILDNKNKAQEYLFLGY
jgi:DNA adenine methylase